MAVIGLESDTGKSTESRPAHARIQDHRRHAAHALPRPSRCDRWIALPCLHQVARLCSAAPGALRIRRGEANLCQVHGALLQGRDARADQAGDGLGWSAHVVASSGAGGSACDRRTPAGANSSPATIAPLHGRATQQHASQGADGGDGNKDGGGAQPRLAEEPAFARQPARRSPARWRPRRRPDIAAPANPAAAQEKQQRRCQTQRRENHAARAQEMRRDKP